MRAAGAQTTCLSSPNTRSGATRSSPGARRPISAAVSGSITSSRSIASRTARSVRRGSSARERGPDHPQPPRLEVGAPAVRVEQLPAVQRLGHGVDREVARREVGVDVAVAQPDEVDVPAVARPDHAPGAELAGQPEGGAAGRARQRAGLLLRVLGQRHVEVDRVAAEQPVAHGAADDPRLAPGELPAHLVDDGMAHAAGSPPRWCTRGTRALIPHVIS